LGAPYHANGSQKDYKKANTKNYQSNIEAIKLYTDIKGVSILGDTNPEITGNRTVAAKDTIM